MESENQVLGQPMPPFPEGKEVSSLSIEDAQAEWQAMTTGTDKKYDNWPRDVFTNRRNALWKRGFAQKIADQEKAQAEENKQWLDKENEKIMDREDRDRERRAKEIGIKAFGSEKELDRMVEGAVETVAGLNQENKDFLNDLIPNGQYCYGDLPFMISLLSGIQGEKDLIEAINQVGLERLVRLADKSGIFRRAKR